MGLAQLLTRTRFASCAAALGTSLPPGDEMYSKNFLNADVEAMSFGILQWFIDRWLVESILGKSSGNRS